MDGSNELNANRTISSQASKWGSVCWSAVDQVWAKECLFKFFKTELEPSAATSNSTMRSLFHLSHEKYMHSYARKATWVGFNWNLSLDLPAHITWLGDEISYDSICVSLGETVFPLTTYLLLPQNCQPVYESPLIVSAHPLANRLTPQRQGSKL